MVSHRHGRHIALGSVLLGALLLWSPGAAQMPPASLKAPAPASGCPAPDAITPTHLFGLWQLTLGTPVRPGGEGQLVFRQHPEFPGSVRGSLERGAHGLHQTAQVAGDVTDQGFQLEESADGTTIDAVWSGDVWPGSCGREIRGWRRVLDNNSTQEAATEQAFRLQKTPGWR